MNISFGVCFAVALYYWFCNQDLGSIGRALMNPTLIGCLFGAIYGDVTRGCILGASINVLYIANAAIGANMPSDDSLAACVAIPVALVNNLDATSAVLLAVPFGILGTFMDNARRAVNGIWNRKAIACAQKGDTRGMALCNVLYPLLVQFAIRVPIVTAIMVGVSAGTQKIMEVIPAWLMNGFSVVGGVLPGFGLMLCAVFIGRSNLFPFLIIGFFVAKISGMSMLTNAVFGAMIAIIYTQLAFPKQEGEEAFSLEALIPKGVGYDGALTKKDVKRTAWRIVLLHRYGNSLEAMYGTGVGHAMAPVLEKIYKDDQEGLNEALERHLMPYISEMCMGNCIMGAATAMEEQLASGDDSITAEDIMTLKSSLMGPFAGFGDSLLYSTIAPVIRTIFLPLAIQGSVAAGLIMEPLIRIGCCFLGIVSFDIGYKTGRKSIITLLKGGMMKKLMAGVGVLGMYMLGAMGASYCKLNLKLEIVSETLDKTYNIQSMLDGILPGLLPILMLVFTYRYFLKGGKYIKLIIVVFIAGLLLSYLHIV